MDEVDAPDMVLIKRAQSDHGTVLVDTAAPAFSGAAGVASPLRARAGRPSLC